MFNIVSQSSAFDNCFFTSPVKIVCGNLSQGKLYVVGHQGYIPFEDDGTIKIPNELTDVDKIFPPVNCHLTGHSIFAL